MNEKVFKTMGFAGIAGIVNGVIMIVVGVAVGIVAITSGVRLIKERRGLTF